MSITSGPVNEAEQAAEKFADHAGAAAVPIVKQVIDAIFDKITQLRIVIDIGRREMPK